MPTNTDDFPTLPANSALEQGPAQWADHAAALLAQGHGFIYGQGPGDPGLEEGCYRVTVLAVEIMPTIEFRSGRMSMVWVRFTNGREDLYRAGLVYLSVVPTDSAQGQGNRVDHGPSPLAPPERPVPTAGWRSTGSVTPELRPDNL